MVQYNKSLELLLLKETNRHFDFICIFLHFFINLSGVLSRYHRCQKIHLVSYGYMSENKFTNAFFFLIF